MEIPDIAYEISAVHNILYKICMELGEGSRGNRPGGAINAHNLFIANAKYSLFHEARGVLLLAMFKN